MRARTVRFPLLCCLSALLLSNPVHLNAQIAIRYSNVRVSGSISAKIVDPNGDSLPGAVVTEMDKNWKETFRTTKTDVTGTFTLAPVKGRKIYHIMVRSDNLRQIEFKIRVSRLRRKILILKMENAS